MWKPDFLKMPDKEKLQDLIYLAMVLFSALVFRLFLKRYLFAISFDEVNYLKLAAAGASSGLTQVLHTFWSPFYPLVVALLSKVVPDFELAARLVSILSGTFIIIPVFIFAKYHFNRKVAYYAVLFLAFYPPLAFLNTGARTEALYTLLSFLGIWTGWIALVRRSWLLGFLTGLIFGMAYLTRPEGVSFLIVFLGLAVGVLIFSRRKNRRFSWFLVPAAIISFSLTALPYAVYLKRTTGEWTLSAKKSIQQGEAFALTKEPEDDDVFRMLSKDNTQVPIDQIYHIGNFSQVQKQRGDPLIKVTPGIIIEKYAKNLYEIVKNTIPMVLTAFIFGLMILGLVGETWSKERMQRELYLLAYISFFWFLLIPMFHINSRYFLPFLPICFIWVAKGIEFLNSWLKGSLTRCMPARCRRVSPDRLAKAVVLLLILCISFFPEAGKIVARNRWSSDYWAGAVGQKTAGMWIREHASETPVIMSRNHAVDFYAGNYNIAESVTIPHNRIERVLEYASNRGVDYIVLSERYKEDYPKLAHLLDERDIPEGLILVYSNIDESGLKTVIYQMKKD